MKFPSPPSPGSHPEYDLLPWREPRRRAPARVWAGLAGIAVFELLMALKIEPVYTHFTLFVWWAYILLLDGLILWRRGVSFLSGRPRFFAFMAVASVFWWLVFEFYNCYIENWVYVGLPLNIPHRYTVYLLAFATITPAIVLTYGFALTWFPPNPRLDLSKKPRSAVPWLWFAFGLLCVTVPLLVPDRGVRHYLFGFVWIGFVFLLEPLAYWSGGYSLMRLWSAGGRALVWNVFGAGALCGLLWEFWNYWAGAKWFYTVPITQTVRYFEMPALGFLGFLPFAWECLVLLSFTSLVLGGRFAVRPSGTPRGAAVAGARALFAFLALFWVGVGLSSDPRHFPAGGFSLGEPGFAPPAGEPLEPAEFIQRYIPAGSLGEGMTAEAFAAEIRRRVRWTRSSVELDTFAAIPDLQRHPDPGTRRRADGFLREYAIAARFNWANERFAGGEG